MSDCITLSALAGLPACVLSNKMKRLKKLSFWLVSIAVSIGLAAVLVFRMPVFGASSAAGQSERLRRSPQFRADHFENTPPLKDESDLKKTIQNYLKGQERKPRAEVPVVKLAAAEFSKSPEQGLRAYWFGHSSVLIEIDGIRVMTDPVFSEYASPFQWIGPKRLHPVPLPLEQMPALDAVLISHDHYDHLDMTAVKYLGAKGTQFFVPLGVGADLLRWGIPPQQIQEMDWWDSASIKGVQVHCAPARHYSGRKGVDNSTLWSGWLVRGPQHSFYYSGDTGYSSQFAETRARLGTVELALLKVGAYGDTWLDIQMDPESAVQAQQDLGAQVLLPVHWATFNLSYHSWKEPIVRTLKAAGKAGVQVITPAPGQKFEFGKPFENRTWFQQQ